MSEIQLTKDADALICVLYKEYLQRRENGIPKSTAKRFGGSPNIHSQLMSKWSFEDVDETCRELSRAGLLKCFYADNIAYDALLSDAGIIYMEKRFANGLKSVLNYLERIKAFLPW